MEAQRRNRILIALAVLAVVLFIDLWSKAWVWNEICQFEEKFMRCARPGANSRRVEVISGLFYLNFGFNTGAAFSLFRDDGWARTFFIVVTFLALGYMGWLALKMPSKRLYGFIAIGMIAGGAIGNLHDRFVRVLKVPWNGKMVERHGVVDFLQFYYPWNPDEYWPIFNVADMALVVGVGLLLIYMLRHGEEDVEETEASESTSAEPSAA